MKKFLFVLFTTTSICVFSQPFVGLSGLVNSPTKENNHYELGFGMAFQGGYRFGNNLDVGVSGLKSWIYDGIQDGNQFEIKAFAKYIITKKLPASPFVGISGGIFGMSINPSNTQHYWTGLMAMPIIGLEAGAKQKGLAIELLFGYKVYDMTKITENYGPGLESNVLTAKVGVKYIF